MSLKLEFASIVDLFRVDLPSKGCKALTGLNILQLDYPFVLILHTIMIREYKRNFKLKVWRWRPH